ncbi:unnamed protein product [Ascophyllum nodosum]
MFLVFTSTRREIGFAALLAAVVLLLSSREAGSFTVVSPPLTPSFGVVTRSSAWGEPRSIWIPSGLKMTAKIDKGDHDTADPSGIKLNKGFGILELAGGLIPQGGLVKTARAGWKFIWLQMMRELAPQSPDGSYVRPSYGFRGWIGRGRFPVEAGRYHVYVGNTCPWCHRAVLAIVLRGLSPGVTFSYMDDNPDKASRGGWAFTPEEPDPVFRFNDLREVYEACSPGFTGRCTAPVVVDKKAKTVVTNESSQIVRMLNGVDFGEKEHQGGSQGAGQVDLCPASLEEGIDNINDFIYNKINNGVYRAGFSTSQVAYAKACRDVFEGLSRCEEILSKNRFLVGDRFTEADLRLIPTAVRFDAVYATLFKCSNKRWRDFPSLYAWLRDVYQLPGVAETIDIEGARRSYFAQLFPLNPGGIVPLGPSVEDLGLNDPVERGSRDPSDVFWLKESVASQEANVGR